jgi:hypothetical protein
MQKFLASLALVVCLAGCANRDPKIITRRDPAYFPAATNRLALSSHGQSRAEDEVLRAALRSELTRRGFHLTTATNADFVLAYWIQDDWNSMRPGGWHVGAGNFAPVGNITYENSPVTAPGSLTVGVTSDGRL